MVPTPPPTPTAGGFGSIVFRPGVPTSMPFVETWAEVKAFVASLAGSCIVYVDDGVVSPAVVPASSGVTDFQGRGEIRSYRQDFLFFSTLVIEDGAQLKSIYRLSGTIEVEGDTHGALPAFDWDYTPNVLGTPQPVFYLEDYAALGTTTTATAPVIVVAVGQALVALCTSGGGFFMQGATSIVSVPATSTFEGIFFQGANFGPGLVQPIPPNWVSGAGSYFAEFDSDTVFGSEGGGTSPTAAVTNTLIQRDASQPIFSQAVYVSKAGNDDWNGTVLNPFLTIQKALTSITDATTAKRYCVYVGPGEYAGAFQIKPWCAVVGTPTSSGFYGLVEITAPPDTCGLDPVAFPGAGFSVVWYSHLVFANHQTWSEIAAGNNSVQGTFFDVDFNGGFSFIGPATSGVDNWTLDNCIVYGGALAQGIQFLFTIGGTQFLGGTVTVQAAPSAGALASTTWLGQNTAVGSAFNPTNVIVLWAAPTPVGQFAKVDFSNVSVVGAVTINGASTSYASTVEGIPPSVTLMNGAVSPVLQTKAQALGYTPATPGNWAIPPTQVAQALDELAANGSGSVAAKRVQYWSGVPATTGAGVSFGSNCLLVIGDTNVGTYQSGTSLLGSCSRGTAFSSAAGPVWLGSYDFSAATGSYKTSFVLRGAAPGIGGFSLATRFGIELISATPSLQAFVGLIDASGGGGGLPQTAIDFTTQTTLQCVGIAFTQNLAAGPLANWKIVSCNGAAVTVTDSGVPIVVGNLVELLLVALPDAATIAWTINDLTASTSTSGVIAATLPASTLALAWQAGLEIVSGGSAAGNTFATVRYTMTSNN